MSALDSFITKLVYEQPEAQILLAADLNVRIGPNDKYLKTKFNFLLCDSATYA